MASHRIARAQQISSDLHERHPRLPWYEALPAIVFNLDQLNPIPATYVESAAPKGRRLAAAVDRIELHPPSRPRQLSKMCTALTQDSLGSVKRLSAP